MAGLYKIVIQWEAVGGDFAIHCLVKVPIWGDSSYFKRKESRYVQVNNTLAQPYDLQQTYMRSQRARPILKRGRGIGALPQDATYPRINKD